jgi:hypothetical protein
VDVTLVMGYFVVVPDNSVTITDFTCALVVELGLICVDEEILAWDRGHLS